MASSLVCWTQSTHVQVVNCYLECYGHTYNKMERHKLAQTITSCLHRRPRFDVEANYFTLSYEMEVKSLKMECQLLQDLINYQLMEERTYNQQTCGVGESPCSVTFYEYGKFIIVKVEVEKAVLKSTQTRLGM